MIIRCPECHFERQMDDNAIPANAVMATCPHCQCRFRFRNPDGTPVVGNGPEGTAPVGAEDNTPKQIIKEVQQDVNASQASAQNGTQEPHIPDSSRDDLPPGAISPELPPDNDVPHAAERRTDPRSDSRDSKKSDLPPQRNARPANALEAILEKFRQKMGNAEQSVDGVPWEQFDRRNIFQALYMTILQVMFNAPRFFTNLPNRFGGFAKPLIFYVIIGLFQTLIERMWYLQSLEAAAPVVTDERMQQFIGDMTQAFSLPMTLLISPCMLILQLIFLTAVFFLMFRLVQPDHADFRTVFRVVAYSAAPGIVSIVPVIGSTAATIWFAVNCFVGCKYALRLPFSRTALALGPLYLIAVAIGLQFVRQLSAL